LLVQPSNGTETSICMRLQEKAARGPLVQVLCNVVVDHRRGGGGGDGDGFVLVVDIRHHIVKMLVGSACLGLCLRQETHLQQIHRCAVAYTVVIDLKGWRRCCSASRQLHGRPPRRVVTSDWLRCTADTTWLLAMDRVQASFLALATEKMAVRWTGPRHLL
jgi:hypothetical protein